MAAGRISEWQATLICRETACLDPELRREADARLVGRLVGLGDAGVAREAARVVAELDPAAVAERAAKAAKDRRVTVRPAPDTMAYLTALLPAANAVSCYAALNAYATLAVGEGDARGRGQIMADALTERLTGGTITGCDQQGGPIRAQQPDEQNGGRAARRQVLRDAGEPCTCDCPATGASAAPDPGRYRFPTLREVREKLPPVPPAAIRFNINVIMSDRTLWGHSDEPADLVGFGPIPADVARDLVAADLGPAVKTFLRRFYTDPDTGQLAAMDSTARFFSTHMKQFMLVRDRECRTPYCHAPARHADHADDHARGGPTDVDANGNYRCERCNHTKQAPGWRVRRRPDGVVVTTTPTGHSYESAPPTPPGAAPPARGRPAPRRPAEPAASHVGPAVGPREILCCAT